MRLKEELRATRDEEEQKDGEHEQAEEEEEEESEYEEDDQEILDWIKETTGADGESASRVHSEPKPVAQREESKESECESVVHEVMHMDSIVISPMALSTTLRSSVFGGFDYQDAIESQRRSVEMHMYQE